MKSLVKISYLKMEMQRTFQLEMAEMQRTFQLKDPEELEPAWEGPCLMGDLCGGSHVPEECDLFIGLSQRDRLAVVARKRLCYLCFRHADSRPCQLQSSLPSCSIGGCMRIWGRAQTSR